MDLCRSCKRVGYSQFITNYELKTFSHERLIKEIRKGVRRCNNGRDPHRLERCSMYKKRSDMK